MSLRWLLSAAIAAPFGSLLLALPTQAQEPPRAAQAEEGLEEVLITARKRQERLQEVPTSSIALDAQALRDLDINDGRSLVFQAPGALVIDTGPSFDNEIIVRGAGAGRQTNAEVAAGLYRNGAFIAGGNLGGRNFNTMDFFDAERVEVLRGPQGALFGRNAVGGAINIISARPTEDTSFQLRGSAGTQDSVELSGVANIDLQGNAAARLGFLHRSQHDGFYTNSDGSPLDTSRFNGGRVGLRFTPSERLDIRLTADAFSELGPSFAVFFYNKVGGQDAFNRNFRHPSKFTREEFTGILEVDYSFDWATLSSVTYRRDRQAERRDEVSTSLFFPPSPTTVGLDFRAIQTDDFARNGQELRLTSNGEGPLTWLIGAEYTNVEDFTVNQNLGGIAPQLNNTNRATSDDSSHSFFGSVGLDLTQALNVTVEARMSEDNKSILLDIDRRRSGTGAPIKIVRPFEGSWTNTAWVGSASYQLTPLALVYARVATAYRPGGFNDDPGGSDNTFAVAYDQEETIAYELGWKTEWLDRRLRFNGAVFRSETEGLLENQSQLSTEQARTVRFITNAGNIEHTGIETEVQSVLRLGPSTRFRLSVAGARNWSEYLSGPNTGREVSRIRPWTASVNASFNFNLGQPIQPFLRASYRGEWGGLQNSGLLRPQDDVKNLDLALGLRADDWTITARVRNALDAVYDLDRLTSNTPGVEAYRRNAPRTVSLQFSREF